ncbi:ZNF131 isoform 4, partial [Pongo abelii]
MGSRYVPRLASNSWAELLLPNSASQSARITSVSHRAHPHLFLQSSPTAMEAEETMECLQEFPEHHKMILDRLNEQREQD